MLHLSHKLSSRQKFWFGLACCPFVTWFVLAGIYFVGPYGATALLPHLQSLSRPAIAFCILVAMAFVGGIPFVSGFCAAFFWHKIAPIPTQEMHGFWSAIVTWLPATIFFQSSGMLFTAFAFTLFMFLYCLGLWHGNSFWNSSRPRHLLGDYSDFGSSKET